MSTAELQLKAPPDIRTVAQFLRSGKAGLKVRVGALNGKRLDYFKGAQLYLTIFVIPLITSSREIRRQSPPLPGIRQTKKCTQSNHRSRGSSHSPIHQRFRLFPPRTARRVDWLLFLTENLTDNTPANVRTGRVLCVVI
jgi:hypothetical protein